jgi:transcriptional regulator with XRE-family HTH domain
MSIVSSYSLTGGVIPQAVSVFVEEGKKPAAAEAVSTVPPAANPSMPARRLHRLAEARRREGLTHRKVAGRLGVPVDVVKQQEDPASDMLLSELYRWQNALDVPAAELLSEPNGDLSPPVQLRARLLRVMKSARSIQERTRQASIRRLATMLVEQLVEIVPELKDTTAWPAVGQRRSNSELGQAFYRRLSLDPLDELDPPGG